MQCFKDYNMAQNIFEQPIEHQICIGLVKCWQQHEQLWQPQDFCQNHIWGNNQGTCASMLLKWLNLDMHPCSEIEVQMQSIRPRYRDLPKGMVKNLLSNSSWSTRVSNTWINDFWKVTPPKHLGALTHSTKGSFVMTSNYGLNLDLLPLILMVFLPQKTHWVQMLMILQLSFDVLQNKHFISKAT